VTVALIGSGTPAYRFPSVTGRARWFRSPSDVIESIDSDLESTIALVESGGTTFLSPILGRLGGIICQDGTLRSHLAIVSREFEVPCLVGTQLLEVPADGAELILEAPDAETGRVSQRPADADAAPSAHAGGNVSQRWWEYVRRPGDEIGVKEFDLAVTPADLDTLITEHMLIRLAPLG